ncbi:MAG: phosphoribosylformylglycinamidine synthase subunit PurS [Armatimonadota bacterium]
MPKANVYITLKPSLLDAQGKVVQGALEKLGFTSVSNVRIGKYIQIDLQNGNDLEQQVDEMCRRLLANPVIEDYRFEIEK